MKNFAATLMLLYSINCFSQYADPNYPIPVSGYGADGTHAVALETFDNPNFPGHTVNIYHPADISTPVPTIFYSHAYGGTDPDNIIGMLNFVAKKGYAIVFVPYQTLASTSTPERYANLIAGFRKAAQDYPNIVSTDKVGFMGHSFGGGASFGIAHELFTTDGWGTNGRFIYALAEWYSYNADNSVLNSYPDNTKVLIEVFTDDTTNDHRMAIDIFDNLNVTPSEKDFVMVPSSTVNGYNYQAVHNLPNTSAAFDALDYYAYYRFIDALADYTFNGAPEGKDVALGHGSAAQVTMPGEMNPLQSMAAPYPIHPQSYYSFPCSYQDNPRADYCTAAAIDDIAGTEVVLFPNPVNDVLNVSTTAPQLNVNVYNSLGQKIAGYSVQDNYAGISMEGLAQGIYLVEVNGSTHKILHN